MIIVSSKERKENGNQGGSIESFKEIFHFIKILKEIW